jgi:hypothetical protein
LLAFVEPVCSLFALLFEKRQRTLVWRSVTRFGEISPFGRYFWRWGQIFTAKYRPMIWGHFLNLKIGQNSPKQALHFCHFYYEFHKILMNNFLEKKSLIRKASFWAIF